MMVERSRDLELVRGLDAGDSRVQADVYEHFKDRVFSTVYRIVKGDPVASDITHDAFIRAFEQSSKFRGDSDLGTWIGRIAINLALEHLRRRRRFDLFRIEKTLDTQVVKPTIIEAIDLDSAIRGLPDSLRTAFILVSVEGLDAVEAAQKLRITEAACRQRVHRARMSLASTLSDYRTRDS